MLTRIATLSIVALSAASAWAAPPDQTAPIVAAEKPAAKPTALMQRTNPPVAVPKNTPMSLPVVEVARIERFEEGMIFYSVEIPVETRELMAQKKGVPLSRIHERSVKSARVDYRSLTHRQVKDKIGDEVVLELRQDPLGYVYATSLTAKKPK